MGVGGRSATCASCGKRLNYKSWYYRNGKHYCKRRCWDAEQAKAAKDSAAKTAEAAKAKAVGETAKATPAA